MRWMKSFFSDQKKVLLSASLLAGLFLVASAAAMLAGGRAHRGEPSSASDGASAALTEGASPTEGTGVPSGSGLSQGSSVSGSGPSSRASSASSGSSSTPSGTSSAVISRTSSSGQLDVWTPPAGTAPNNSYSLYARLAGASEWTPVFIYNVKVGHQEGADPLRALVGMEYNGPIDTSMARLDFLGKIELKVTYNKSALNSLDISPDSYGIRYTQEKNTIYFTLEQDADAPRKVVIRANGDWDKNVLHILTDPPEKDQPAKSDPNVYVIAPGDPVPRVLPEGKDTYYFDTGVHELPRGAWAEFDIGRAAVIDRFDFVSGAERPFLVPGPQDFRIEYKLNAGDAYKVCCEVKDNDRLDIYGGSFDSVKARYIRIILLGNHASQTGSGYNYLNSNHVKEFRVFEKGTQDDVIQNKGIDGSSFNYSILCDGYEANNSYYGHVYSAESFFLARDGYTVYLAPGAIVRGAINADSRDGITIKGRGILDCSGLTHDPAKLYAEGRTSAIRAEYTDRLLIEGITVLDPPMWAIVVNHSTGPVVRGVDMFGSIVNADGIHMSGVSDGLAEGCFIRSTDDLFVMYHYGPAQTVTVRNSVFLSDGARIVLLGMADTPGDIRDVTFENNDILNVQNVWDLYKHGGAFSLWASGGNTISGILFSNVRIEPFREPRIASLFQIKTVDESGWGAGIVDGVTFRNVTYAGSGESVSYLLGAGPGNMVRNIRFENFVCGGKVMTDKDHPNIDIRDYTGGISFSR